MKLETLLAKDYILAIDALGCDIRLAIEETIGRYMGDTAAGVACGLGEIALDTKDKDVVIESARTIGRYEGDTARGVAWGLGEIALNTKDKDVVIESARTIGRYEGWTAGKIAYGLEGIAIYTKDKAAILNVARIMSLDEIINTIKKEKKYTTDITDCLLRIAEFTKDKDSVIESARTIGRYEGDNALGVAGGLRRIALNTKDKDVVIESARTIGRYEGYTAIGVASELGEIALDTKDKDVVIESARTIGRYEGDTAREVALYLENVVWYTGDKDTVIESERTIGRYEGDTAREIAGGLVDIAFETKDKDAVRAACGIVNKVGKQALDLLNLKDITTISRKGLDKLIDQKEDFNAVAAYVKSGCILPLPTRENIKTYEKLAYRYVSDTYGISKELGIEKMLMLFSIDEEKRKGLARLINKSTERNRKEYSVSDGGDKMDIDRSKLPYLLLLAVTGSRDKLKEEEAFRLASGIVGEKTVNRARNSFNSSYKSKLPEIISYVNRDEVDKAINILKSTKDESINDVLACMDYRDTGFSGGNAVLSAVESNDPLDYDSRVQIACVYLPRSYNEGIYEYCKDDRFTLVRYDIGGKTLGSAICYIEDGTFLVDSVEGHRTFRKPKIFDAVRRDLMERAKEKGAKRILFSEGGTNETPKKFMDYLGHLGLKKGKIKMKLDTEGYLEADEDGASGYVWEP